MTSEIVTLKGASGQSYRFALATPGARFNKVGAVYAFLAWRVRSAPFFVAYIGQTSDFMRRFRHHDIWPEAEAEWGTNLIAGTVLENPQARSAMERDLIRAYAPPLNMAGDMLTAQAL